MSSELLLGLPVHHPEGDSLPVLLALRLVEDSLLAEAYSLQADLLVHRPEEDSLLLLLVEDNPLGADRILPALLLVALLEVVRILPAALLLPLPVGDNLLPEVGRMELLLEEDNLLGAVHILPALLEVVRNLPADLLLHPVEDSLLGVGRMERLLGVVCYRLVVQMERVDFLGIHSCFVLSDS